MSKRVRTDVDAPPPPPPREIGLQDLPLDVLLVMFTSTPGVPTNLAELVARLRASGYTKGARFIEQHMGRPGFWRDIVRQCFPLVTQLPAHIEEALRGGQRYYNVPDDVNLPATEPRDAPSQAWRDAFRYILGVLNSAHVRVLRSTGVEYPPTTLVPNTGFLPPLALAHNAVETCDSYVGHEHTVAVSYLVEEEDQAPFTFYLDMSSHGGGDDDDDDEQGMSDDELEIGVEYEELPTLSKMVRQVGNPATVAQLLNRGDSPVGGAFVYRGVARVPEPFNDVIGVGYDVRWNTHITNLSERFKRIVPPALTVRAMMEARLVVRPWRVDDHFLYAVDARQTRPRSTRVRVLGTPVHWIIDAHVNGRLVHVPSDETLPARFRLGMLWLAALRKLAPTRSTATEAAIHFDVDVDWAARDGAVSRTLHIDHESRALYERTLLVEVIGPVRPMRPVLADAPEAAWYPAANRKPRVTIHVRTG